MESCSLKIFEISKLCLSDYRENLERLGGIDSFFKPMLSFLTAKTLANTKMSLSKSVDIYCYDIKKHKDDYIIALWVGMSGSNGNRVSTLDKSGAIGSRPSSSRISSRKIAGIPAYFYVSSKHNKILTLEFEGSSGDSKLITQYVKDFMHNYSHYANHDHSDGKKSFGFKFEKNNDLNCYFSFEIKRFINASVEKDLILNYRNIKSIRTKSKVEVFSSTSSTLLDLKPIMQFFSDKKDLSVITTTVKMEVPVTFESESEIKDYIKNIKSTGDEGKVGFFLFDGVDRKTVYLNNSQAKDKVVLENGNYGVSGVPVWPYNCTDISKSLDKDDVIESFIKSSLAPAKKRIKNKDEEKITSSVSI